LEPSGNLLWGEVDTNEEWEYGEWYEYT
jgi:hypothetical protein